MGKAGGALDIVVREVTGSDLPASVLDFDVQVEVAQAMIDRVLETASGA
jgi:hypothetical protein